MHPWATQTPSAERLCTLFATPIGHCGLAWRSEGLTHVLLGAADAESASEALRWDSGAQVAPLPWPAFVAETIEDMQSLLGGRRSADFAAVPLDWTGIGAFERDIYEAVRRIGVGRLVSCDEVAELAGAPGKGRAADVVLGRNPWPLIVPSHRVLSLREARLGEPQLDGTPARAKLLAIEAALAAAS